MIEASINISERMRRPRAHYNTASLLARSCEMYSGHKPHCCLDHRLQLQRRGLPCEPDTMYLNRTMPLVWGSFCAPVTRRSCHRITRIRSVKDLCQSSRASWFCSCQTTASCSSPRTSPEATPTSTRNICTSALVCPRWCS